VAVAEEGGRMCRASCFDSWTRLLALARAGEDEPPSGRLSRRGFLAAAATPVLAAACAARALPPPPGPTRDLLEATLSFDLHSHPGLFPSTASDTLAGHRRSAEAGLVKVISLTATSDAPVIARSASGGLRATRQPRPGELYASMWRQMDLLRTWSAGAGMPLVLRAEELGVPASAPVRGILAVEGCDFLEGRVERAHGRGHRRHAVCQGIPRRLHPRLRRPHLPARRRRRRRACRHRHRHGRHRPRRDLHELRSLALSRAGSPRSRLRQGGGREDARGELPARVREGGRGRQRCGSASSRNRLTGIVAPSLMRPG